MPARQRAALLKRWNDLILANQEDLGNLISREQGKPLAEGRGEVVYAASYVEWFAEEATRANGDVIPTPVAGRRMSARKEPVGVVAAITPSNFPAAMIARKIAAVVSGLPSWKQAVEILVLVHGCLRSMNGEIGFRRTCP